MNGSVDDRPSKVKREVNAAPEPEPETFRVDDGIRRPAGPKWRARSGRPDSASW